MRNDVRWGESKMKVVLMQPYFFPYLGYFTMIKQSDLFVFFDTAQYIRRGWIHRNRIVGPNGNPVYINANIVKAPQNTPIKHIKLNGTNTWKQEIFGKLETYKHIAPNYKEINLLVKECLYAPSPLLADLNVHSLTAVCNFLDLPFNYERFSELKINTKDINEPDDWGLKVSQYFGAETYINAPGGQGFYNKEKYEQHGVNMLFYKTKLGPYDQKQSVFHPGLSIIDVMMFNSKKEIHQMLDQYDIL